MGLPVHIGLVPDKVDIPASDLTRVAGALSKQVQRDFGPIWNVEATVDPFVRLEDVPVDYWHIVVMKEVKDAAGYHQTKDGQPYAVVEFDPDWSLTASHECVEMLADPFGRRLKAGNLLDQAVALGQKPARVQYLLEVADPSEATEFSYQIDGIQVSDFYTPHFFDPVKSPGVRYSFTGSIDSPRKVLDDGYISWKDPRTKHWFQLRMFKDEFSSKVPHLIDLSTETVFEKLIQTEGLRGASDRVTKRMRKPAKLAGPGLMAAHVGRDIAIEAQLARADELREEIALHVEAAGNHSTDGPTPPKPKGKKR